MTHGCVPRRFLRRGFLFHTATILITALLLICCDTAVHAVTSLGTEEQRLRQQRDARARQERLDAPDLLSDVATPLTAPGKLPVETPCFTLQNLQLSIPDASLARNPEWGQLVQPGGRLSFLQHHLNSYRGQCIGREGINQLVRQLTALLLERGYTTTRVGVPAQDLSSGELQLSLIPGMIRSFEVAADVGHFSTNAIPARTGQLLNIRDLEQGLEQMMRLPSQDVSFDLVPGEHPGESDILVRLTRGRPVHAQLSVDDAGSDDTGRWRTGLTLTVDGPLGLHDQLEIGYQDNTDHANSEQRSEELRLRYAIPWGWWRGELTASRYEYSQQIEGRNQSFTSSGETERIGAALTYTLFRGERQKLDMQLSARHRNSSSFIDGIEIMVQQRDLTEAEAAIVHRINLGRARLDLKAAHHWGTSWFGAQEDFADRFPNDPTFFYRLQTLDATLGSPITVGPLQWYGTLTFHSQYSAEQLFASEQLAIGSRHTVRGFDGEQMLSAERGVYLRSDLDIPLARTGQMIYLGLDYGKVSGPSARYLPGKELIGGTVGLRGGWKGLSYETFASWPFKKPDGLETDEPALGVSLSWVF